MKRIISVGISVLLIVSVLCGCFNNNENVLRTAYKEKIENSEIVYPLYESLNGEEKEKYIDLCTAIEEHNENLIQVGMYDTEEEADAAIQRVQCILIELAFEHPEYFWVDPYVCLVDKNKLFGKYFAYIRLTYIIDKEEAVDKKALFDEKANEILNSANEKELLFDKLLYIYDTILSGAVYDQAVVDSKETATLVRTAYGCLVDGNTICSGYSMAFNYFLQKLGIESGVEFNNYDHFKELDEEGHVWNYCKLDGEYYYFDLTWDDTAFIGDEYKQYIDHSHIYFGVTKEELSKSNFTLTSDAPTPHCNGTKYNYFKYKNYNIPEYSYDLVKKIMLEQSENKYIELRFDEPDELLKAEDELMLQGYSYSILPSKENIRYFISGSGLHMYIIFD